MPTFTIKFKLSVESRVQLRADFYNQGKLSVEASVQLRDDFYGTIYIVRQKLSIWMIKIKPSVSLQLSADCYHEGQTQF